MDLLCNAYNNSSDDDEEEENKGKRQKVSSFSSKPIFSPSTNNYYSQQLQSQTLIPGGYISKRQRALFEVNHSTVSNTNPPMPMVSPSVDLSGNSFFLSFLLILFFCWF